MVEYGYWGIQQVCELFFSQQLDPHLLITGSFAWERDYGKWVTCIAIWHRTSSSGTSLSYLVQQKGEFQSLWLLLVEIVIPNPGVSPFLKLLWDLLFWFQNNTKENHLVRSSNTKSPEVSRRNPGNQECRAKVYPSSNCPPASPVPLEKAVSRAVILNMF